MSSPRNKAHGNGKFNQVHKFLFLLILGISGCTTVESTSVYYMPYTTKAYPPKPPDAPIPILGKAPPERYTAIGKLEFSTDLGWRFLHKSMVYNAQRNGADAVILKKFTSRRDVVYTEVPPRMDWMPVPGGYYRNNKGQTWSYTNWVPIYRPGYIQPWMNEITAIDAEMIVLKK